MQYLESDGSNFEIYSVTDREPVEISKNRGNMAKARFLGNDPSKCVLYKLQASKIRNRRASQERVTVIESRTHYCGSYCFASLSGEGRTDVAECTNVKVRCLACFGNLFVKGHPRVKMNTQIFYWWLELDGWTGNWNGFNGFSQGFERFGPWVEKCNGFRLGWIEVKTIVQKPVVDPLGARFYWGNLMNQRGCISTDIQLGVISILMKGHQVGCFWQVGIYYIGNSWYEKHKKKWAKDRALGHTCGYCCGGWGWWVNFDKGWAICKVGANPRDDEARQTESMLKSVKKCGVIKSIERRRHVESS